MSDKLEKPAWEELEGELRDAVKLVVEENVPQPLRPPVPRIRRNRKKTHSLWSGRGAVLVASISLCLAVVAFSLSGDPVTDSKSYPGTSKVYDREHNPQYDVPSYWNYRFALAESPEAFERMLDRNTSSMNDQTETLSAFSLRRIDQIKERKM